MKGYMPGGISPRSSSLLRLIAVLCCGALGVAGIFWLAGNGYLSSKDDEETPLSYLALKLESQFRRDIHKNPYSIDYSARSPNTIVIAVSYYSSVDRALLNSIVRAADENAKGVARDQFHLNIGVETNWTALGKPPEGAPTMDGQ
jgi:hypothetical protein